MSKEVGSNCVSFFTPRNYFFPTSLNLNKMVETIGDKFEFAEWKGKKVARKKPRCHKCGKYPVKCDLEAHGQHWNWFCGYCQIWF